jgi:hypothetical protein
VSNKRTAKDRRPSYIPLTWEQGLREQMELDKENEIVMQNKRRNKSKNKGKY